MKKIGMAVLGFMLVSGWARAESIGLVVAAQGKATGVGVGGAARELALQSEIMLNDTVKTEAKSRLQIMLGDDSLLAVGESSEMVIDEYLFNPANAADNAFGIKMGKGVFRTVTGKITDLNPDRFKVITRRATIGIRGCDLGFDTTAENEDRVAVLAIPEGKSIIITAIESGNVLTVKTPTFVTISSRGIIFQRDLTSADRQAAQQGESALEFPDSGSLTQPEFRPTTDNSVLQSSAQHTEHSP